VGGVYSRVLLFTTKGTKNHEVFYEKGVIMGITKKPPLVKRKISLDLPSWVFVPFVGKNDCEWVRW
jgi:hypothetical protein